MKNKVKVFALSTALALSGMATSCKKEQKQEQSKQAKTVSVDKEREAYFQHVYDSLYVADGAAAYKDSLNAKSYVNYIQSREELTYEFTLGGAMDKAFSERGQKIMHKMYQDIATELSKYKISLSKAVQPYKEEDMFVGFQNTSKDDLSYINCYALYSSAEKTSQDDYEDYEWNALYRWIEDIVNSSDYGDTPKQNMLSNVSGIIKNTRKEIISAKKSVESEFADYYLVANPEYLGITSEGEGAYSFGYEDLNNEWVNGKYLITSRSVHVYDSKLPVDFFGEPDAEYKLVSVGENKWQVIKKTKNGKIQKSHVFSDNSTFSERKFVAETKDFEPSDFYFKPGKNMGIHIDYSEITSTTQRKKDWVVKIPQSVQNLIDHNEKEFKEYDRLRNSYYTKQDSAYAMAKRLTTKRFGSNER